MAAKRIMSCKELVVSLFKGHILWAAPPVARQLLNQQHLTPD